MSLFDHLKLWVNGQILFYFCIFFVGVIFHYIELLFGVKISLGGINILLSLLPMTYYWFLEYRSVESTKRIKSVLVLLLSTLLVICFSALLASLFFDNSEDGQLYHQPAVFELARGWNPFLYYLDDTVIKNLLWVNHYPKAQWIVQASWLNIFLNINAVKFVNFWLMIVVFCKALSFCNKKKILGFRGILFSTLLAFNPISVTQMHSFYLDGVMYAFILFACFEAYDFFEDCNKRYVLWPLILSLVIVANLKYSGVIFSVFCFGGIFLGIILLQLSLQKIKALIYNASIWFGIVAISGLYVYGNNLIKFKDPFYPLNQSKVVEYDERILNIGSFIKVHLPEKIDDEIFYKLAEKLKSHSRVSLMLNNLGDVNNFALNFFVNYAYQTIRIGAGADHTTLALGPFYIYVFIGILFLFLIYFIKQKDLRVFLYLYAVLCVVILPKSDWARLIPYSWSVPIFALMFIQTTNEVVVKKVGNFFLVLLSITCIQVFVTTNIYNSYYSFKLNAEYKKLESFVTSGGHFFVESKDFGSWIYSLQMKYPEKITWVSSNTINDCILTKTVFPRITGEQFKQNREITFCMLK